MYSSTAPQRGGGHKTIRRKVKLSSDFNWITFPPLIIMIFSSAIITTFVSHLYRQSICVNPNHPLYICTVVFSYLYLAHPLIANNKIHEALSTSFQSQREVPTAMRRTG